MSSEGERLEEYLAFLKGADIDDRAVFQRAISEAQTLLAMSSADMARFCKCARPTVGIWSRGEAAPYHGMRKVIFERLAQTALEELQRLESGRE